jgi:hypothetical protein
MGSSRLEVTPRALLPGVQSGAERPTLTALKEKALIGQYLLDLFLAYEGIARVFVRNMDKPRLLVKRLFVPITIAHAFGTRKGRLEVFRVCNDYVRVQISTRAVTL